MAGPGAPPRNRRLGAPAAWPAALGLALACATMVGCSQPADPSGPPPTPAEFVAGQRVYDVDCGDCHDTSHEGAPRLGFLRAWSRRLEQGEPALIDHAINGFADGAMPPRGDNPDLTDEQVAEAVRYMIYRAKLDIPAKGHSTSG